MISTVGVDDFGGEFRSVSAIPEFGHWELVLGSSDSGLLGGGGMLAIPPFLVRLANGWSSSESDQVWLRRSSSSATKSSGEAGLAFFFPFPGLLFFFFEEMGASSIRMALAVCVKRPC